MGYARSISLGDSLTVGKLELFRARNLEPKLEKDTFSGGVNESARWRNETLLDGGKLYLMDNRVFGPEHMLAAAAARMGSVLPVRRRHPALLAWVQWWTTRERESYEVARAKETLARVDAVLQRREA